MEEDKAIKTHLQGTKKHQNRKEYNLKCIKGGDGRIKRKAIANVLQL